MDNKWQFMRTTLLEELIFNKTMEDFHSKKVDAIVRENIQNSLDAKDNSKDFVNIIIDKSEIDNFEIPGFAELKDRIYSLKGGNEYTKSSIKEMKESFNSLYNTYISFEDENTKGLTGAKYGNENLGNNSWCNYAYQKGVHHTDMNSDIEKMRGGSHGIGKIASNAASRINIMFFSNCDVEGNVHVGGTAQLIEHEYKGMKYRSTGYFSKIEGEDRLYPFKYNENDFNPIFNKKTRGLKIIIPFLRETFNNDNDVIKAVCDNFFLAILNDGLKVRFRDLIIDKKNIEEILSNDNIYDIQEIENMKESPTKLYVNTLLNKEAEEIVIRDKKKEKYRFKFYLDFDERIQRGFTAIVRRIGMKIEDRTIQGIKKYGYNSLLIPVGEKEDMMLKSLENESHTKLSSEYMKNKEEAENAQRFLKNLDAEIRTKVKEILDKNVQTDGVIDTQDIIYSVENTFKSILTKNAKVVELNDGDKNKTKTKKLIQVKKNKYEEKNESKETKDPLTHNGIKRDNENGENKRERDRKRYKLDVNTVKRVIIKDSEYLTIDMSLYKYYQKDDICDLGLLIIDGEGKEEKESFNIENHFLNVVDLNSNTQIEMDNIHLKSVEIKDYKIKLKLKYKNNLDSLLKFIYLVEV